MANKYCWSGAAGAGTGADWTNAYTTLGAAATGSAAGDDIWVASDHAESAASAKTITFPGNATSPNRCISVNRAGSVPPVAADITAGASVTTTGANSITVNGNVYMYGITLNAGSGASAGSITFCTTGNAQIHEACAFNLAGTATTSRIVANNATSGAAFCEWVNCTVSFGSTSQGINTSNGGGFLWRDTAGTAAVAGATIPTNLIITSTARNADTRLDGLDLSSLGSGKTLVASNNGVIDIINCKLDASVTVAATPGGGAYARGIRLIGCHSSGNVARNEIYNYAGTLTTETTIKRTGGASDGTTGYSWKLVTTANSERTVPAFESFEGALWNETTGSSKTLTVHTVTDNVTLTDAEIWLEAHYLGASGSPLASLVQDCNATVLTTAANQATSTETWTTTGLTTPVKQKLEVTFTPQMAGPIRWKVKVAKASTTVYICPKAELS